MASRSSVDATRFTATEPHAYSQSTSVRSSAVSASTPRTSPLSQTPSDTSGPNNKPLDSHAPPPQSRIETPKEKLERLRAARFAQRGEQLTTWERTVIRGRVWADRIHRITATSLILFGVLAAGVTAFAVTDMILHNRQKRTAFLNAQHTIYQARVVAAIETEKAGLPLDEHQILVLARERAKVQAEERKKEQGWLKRLTEQFTGGLKKDMEPIVVPSEGDMLEKMGVNSVGVLEASERKAKVNAKGEIEGLEESDLFKAVRQKRVEMGLEEEIRPEEKMGPAEITSTANERRGGMLDRLGEQSASHDGATTSKSSGWLSWGR